MNERLALRMRIKSKKPSFLREDSHKQNKLKNTSWRKPRGRHSKMRHGFHGQPVCANPGYGSPADVKGLHKSGLMPVNISTIKDISELNKSKHAVVIHSTVGQRKRLEIVKKASEMGFKILGIKDPAGYLKKIAEELSNKKASKKQDEKKAKEKVETKKKEEAPETAEEKKKKDTKEFEKMITKREK